ncbi:MAG: DpnD/PcfM family protein [Candidatus Coprovivens sp.]
MALYSVEVVETLSRVLEQDAPTYEDAESIVEEKYDNQEIVLDSVDYKGVEYRQFPSPKIKESFNITIDFDKEEKNAYISTESSSGATYSCETKEDLSVALKTYISNYVEVENDNSNEKNLNDYNKAEKAIVDIISEWEKEQRKNLSEKIKAALRAKKLREEQNNEEEMER